MVLIIVKTESDARYFKMLPIYKNGKKTFLLVEFKDQNLYSFINCRMFLSDSKSRWLVIYVKKVFTTTVNS